MSKRKRKTSYEASRQKVLALEAQLQAMLDGELVEFHCPFCDQVTGEGQFLCCESAATVVNAVLDHVEHLQTKEMVDQIMDQVSRIPTSPVVTLN